MSFQASFVLFGEGQAFFIFCESETIKSFLHLSVYVKTYCKQKVLCNYNYLYSYHMWIWEPIQPGQKMQAGEMVVATVDWKETSLGTWTGATGLIRPRPRPPCSSQLCNAVTTRSVPKKLIVGLGAEF